MTETIAKSLAGDYAASATEILRAYHHARYMGYSEFDAWTAVKSWLVECKGTRRAY